VAGNAIGHRLSCGWTKQVARRYRNQRDMRFAFLDDATPVRVMHVERLIWPCCKEPADRDETISLMKARRIKKAVGHGMRMGKLTGLLTLERHRAVVLEPHACKYDLGRLRLLQRRLSGDGGLLKRSAGPWCEAGVDMIVD